MRRLICVLLALSLLLTLCACGAKLNGTYVGQDNGLEFTFRKDGTCVIHTQDGNLFADYHKTSDGWEIEERFTGLLLMVKKTGPGLYIFDKDGWISEYYTKQ